MSYWTLDVIYVGINTTGQTLLLYNKEEAVILGSIFFHFQNLFYYIGFNKWNVECRQ